MSNELDLKFKQSRTPDNRFQEDRRFP